MKKILGLLIIFITVFTFAACSRDSDKDTTTNVVGVTYYTKEEINNELDELEVLLSGKYSKTEVDTIISDLEDMFKSYYTKSEVESALLNLENTLSNNYTKSEVDTIISGVQSLFDNYYTKLEVDATISNLEVMLNDKYSKQEVDTIIDGVISLFDSYYTMAEVDTELDSIEGLLEDYYGKIQVDAMINDLQTLFNDYYTKSEMDIIIDDLEAMLNDKYSKQEVDTIIDGVISLFDSYYTMAEVDTELDNIEGLLEDYYGKIQVDAMITDLETIFNDYYNKIDIDIMIADLEAMFDDYYTNEDAQVDINDINAYIASVIAMLEDYQTNAESDEEMAVINAAIDDLYGLIENVEGIFVDYYTKAEVLALIDELRITNYVNNLDSYDELINEYLNLLEELENEFFDWYADIYFDYLIFYDIYEYYDFFGYDDFYDNYIRFISVEDEAAIDELVNRLDNLLLSIETVYNELPGMEFEKYLFSQEVRRAELIISFLDMLPSDENPPVIYMYVYNEEVITPIDDGSSNNKDVFLNVFDEVLFDLQIMKDGILLQEINDLPSLEGFILVEEGEYLIIATDEFGNETTRSFIIDKTAPELPIFTGAENSGLYNEGLNLTISSPEIEILYDYNDNGWDVYSDPLYLEDGLHTVAAKAVDEAGNESEIALITFEIDSVAPTLSGLPLDGLTNQDVILTTENESIILISLDNIVWDHYIDALTESGTYYAKAIDPALNDSVVYVFEIDKVAPLVYGLPYDVLTNQDVVLTTDEDASVYVSLDGVSWFEYLEPLTETGDYQVKAIDEATNESIVYSFTLDKDVPSVYGTPPTGLTNQDVDLFTDFDAVILVSQDGGATWEEYFDTLTETGVYLVKAVDLALNESEEIEFEIDKEAPNVYGLPIYELTNQDVVLSTDEDALVYVSLYGGSWVEYLEPLTESGIYIVKAIDEAGNESLELIFEIDKIVPTVYGLPLNGITNQDVTLTTDPDGLMMVFRVDDGYAWFDHFIHLTESGIYEVIVIDEAGNESEPIQFVIDKEIPNVYGVPVDYLTNQDVVLTTDEDASVLFSNDGIIWFEYTEALTESGIYLVKAVDEAGNESLELLFEIDKIIPTIYGIPTDGLTNQDVYLSTDEIATILISSDGVVWDVYEGPLTDNGLYYTMAIDEASNESEIFTFTIDKDVPNIYGIEDGELINENVTLTTDPDAKLTVSQDGGLTWTVLVETIIFTESGTYLVKAVDEASNESDVVTFEIDQILPTIVLSETDYDPGKYLTPVIITVSDNSPENITVTVNGEVITLNAFGEYTFTDIGEYVVTATDEAGNQSTETFTIYTVNPTITLISEDPSLELIEVKVTHITDVVVTVNDIVVTLDEFDTFIINEQGVYTVIAIDEFGNQSTETFSIL